MMSGGAEPIAPRRGTPAGSWPWPPRGMSARTVFILVVGVVTVVGFAFGLWVAANSGLQSGWNGWHVGAIVVRSADGLTWNLTFTTVPSGLTPVNVSLTLVSANGVTLLAAKPLSSLAGGSIPLTNSAGTIYLFYDGRTPGVVSPADSVLVGTTVSNTGASTTGWIVQFGLGTSIIWQGTLQ